MLTPFFSRKLPLQIAVAILSLIPLSVGAMGVLLGPDWLGLDPPWPASLDSHLRYLSGIFLAGGIAFASTIPRIERHTDRFRLLAALVIAGGFARLYSLAVAGVPTNGHLFGLAMELIVTPLLVLWQAKVAAANAAR